WPPPLFQDRPWPLGRLAPWKGWSPHGNGTPGNSSPVLYSYVSCNLDLRLGPGLCNTALARVNTKVVKIPGGGLVQLWDRFVRLHLVQGLPALLPDLFEITGGQTGHLFELVAQVGDTGIVHPQGNLAQGKFPIDQELLYPFYLLGDKIFFQGGTLHLGEQFGQLVVILAKGPPKMLG